MWTVDPQWLLDIKPQPVDPVIKRDPEFVAWLRKLLRALAPAPDWQGQLRRRRRARNWRNR